MPKRPVYTGPDTIGWEDYELPSALAAGQMRICNTHGAEKHGTRMAFLRGHANKRGRWDSEKQIFVPGTHEAKYPFGLGGNMHVGVVEEVGSGVTKFKQGDRISYYAEFAPTALANESQAWKLTEGTSWKSAVCLDPGNYALCAVRDGQVRVGDAVAIFSLGAIGLVAVQMAKLAGAYPVIAIDPLANRRDAATKLGADVTLNPLGLDVGEKLREVTAWQGVDVVIEYSGAMEALQASLRGVAFGGTIVMGAFPGLMKAGLDLGAEAHMNRPNLVFSRSESDPNRDHPRWDHSRICDTVHRMILDGSLNGGPIVTPVLKFGEELVRDYEQISSAPEKNIKLGVEY